MLAVTLNEKLLRFPYFASPKLDGIRCLVLDGHARTRTMRHLPNDPAREWFAKRGELLTNLDGELIVGDPTAPDCQFFVFVLYGDYRVDLHCLVQMSTAWLQKYFL
jgi:DNA ligase 1